VSNSGGAEITTITLTVTANMVSLTGPCVSYIVVLNLDEYVARSSEGHSAINWWR